MAKVCCVLLVLPEQGVVAALPPGMVGAEAEQRGFHGKRL